MNQVVKTMIEQILYILRFSHLVPSEFVFDNKRNTIHFTLSKSKSYITKIIMRYDEGLDLYHLCLMRMYIGKNMNRDDWYSPRLTDWQTEIYVDMLKDVIEHLYEHRADHQYYRISEIL